MFYPQPGLPSDSFPQTILNHQSESNSGVTTENSFRKGPTSYHCISATESSSLPCYLCILDSFVCSVFEIQRLISLYPPCLVWCAVICGATIGSDLGPLSNVLIIDDHIQCKRMRSSPRSEDCSTSIFAETYSQIFYIMTGVPQSPVARRPRLNFLTNTPSLFIQPPSPVDSTNISPSPDRFSASFFSKIDPLLPKRLATVHHTPQYLFPSELNDLPSSRSTPFAFNHHTLAFYWTRDDALTDTSWNIWATPPCLNCVVACDGDGDGDLARRCDFGQRRDRSFGRVQACSRCLNRGLGDQCVEQIEVRKDGSVSARDEDLQGCGPIGAKWLPREVRLRRLGVVEWRPINLHEGDSEAKKSIVEQNDRHKDTTHVHGGKRNWTLPAPSKLLSVAATPSAVSKTRIELNLDCESRGVRQQRLLCAAARVAEWESEELLVKTKVPDNAPEPKSPMGSSILTGFEQSFETCSFPAAPIIAELACQPPSRHRC
jgi:hypothetical protein